MSLLSKAFKWFASGPDAAQKVLDAGIKGIDALVYTEEEKSAAKAKVLDNWLELQKTLGEETTVRGVTRRALAVITIVCFAMLVMGAAISYPFAKEYAQFLLQLAESQFGWLVIGVAGFYFGPYMLNRGK